MPELKPFAAIFFFEYCNLNEIYGIQYTQETFLEMVSLREEKIDSLFVALLNEIRENLITFSEPIDYLNKLKLEAKKIQETSTKIAEMLLEGKITSPYSPAFKLPPLHKNYYANYYILNAMCINKLIKYINKKTEAFKNSQLLSTSACTASKASSPLKFEDLFSNDLYKRFVVDFFVNNGFCSKVNYVWQSEYPQSDLIKILKHLQVKGYYKKGKKITNKNWHTITTDFFSSNISIDTIKKTKELSLDINISKLIPSVTPY